jgi:ABC-type iron transport system FetAB ATPase subunit
MTVPHAGLHLDALSCGSLSNVELSIAPGEIVCLSGPSGSGKTRLLRAIADLDPHDGDVSLDGDRQSCTPAHRWRSWVMLVPAESEWWAELVSEHFTHDGENRLSAVGLPDQALYWEVSRLSSGEKQRLALLRALARGPRALLLDEPTANLDEDSTRQVERLVLAAVQERHLPVLWVAHDPAQISRVADRHLRIDGGRLTGA